MYLNCEKCQVRNEVTRCMLDRYKFNSKLWMCDIWMDLRRTTATRGMKRSKKRKRWSKGWSKLMHVGYQISVPDLWMFMVWLGRNTNHNIDGHTDTVKSKTLECPTYLVEQFYSTFFFSQEIARPVFWQDLFQFLAIQCQLAQLFSRLKPSRPF